MRLAIDSFSAIKADHKIIIIGDMLELGEKSEEEHLKVLKMLQSDIAEKVLLLGPVFYKISANQALKHLIK